jgi:hypothetical protein
MVRIARMLVGVLIARGNHNLMRWMRMRYYNRHFNTTEKTGIMIVLALMEFSAVSIIFFFLTNILTSFSFTMFILSIGVAGMGLKQ